MPTLTIRNLPEDLVARIKSAAARNRRSMEQEVREALARDYRNRAELLAEIERMTRDQKRPTTAEEIDRWRREGRP